MSDAPGNGGNHGGGIRSAHPPIVAIGASAGGIRELQLKLETLSQAHSELQNLMAATDFRTLFLDASLHIKRFTDRVTDLFRLTPADEGRPITEFAHQLAYQDLTRDIRTVLEDLAPVRREIRSRNDRWYDIRMRPYRTVDDRTIKLTLLNELSRPKGLQPQPQLPAR